MNGVELRTAFILSGERGSGKSTIAARLGALCVGHVAGVVTPAVFGAQGKSGIDAIDLRSGERRPLARVRHADPRSPLPLQRATDLEIVGTAGPTIGPYRFDPTTIAWVNRVLRAAAEATQGAEVPIVRPCGSARLIVVDEIGPLELHEHGGFWAGLTAVTALTQAPTSPHVTLLLVVRPSLRDELARFVHSAGWRYHHA